MLAQLWVQLAVLAATVFAKDSELLQLTPEVFNAETLPGLWVIKFYSPTCSHCIDYQKYWSRAVKELEKEGTPVRFAEVNCVAQKQLCKTHDIAAWPSVRVFKDAELFTSVQPNYRSHDVLVKFVRELEGEAEKPASTATVAAASVATASTDSTSAAAAESTAASAEEEKEDTSLTPETFAALKGPTFVKFYSPYCKTCQEFNGVWQLLKRWHPKLQFAEVNCIEQGDLCMTENIPHWPVLRLYEGTTIKEAYPGGKWTYDDVNEFIKRLSGDEDVVREGNSTTTPEDNSVAIDGAQSEASLAAAGETMATPVEASSTSSDTESPPTATEASAVGDVKPEEPAEEEDLLIDLPGLIWKDKIKVSHASGVSEVVDKDTFNSVIIDSHEPWMVKFYHPNCPHCRAMAPTWVEYAESAKGVMNVAEIDCQANFDFCVANGIQFFPNIRYYIGEHFTNYNSGYNVEQFTTFEKMNSGAQVLPVRDSGELKTLGETGDLKGLATFAFAYDASVTKEDWDSLVAQAEKFPLSDSVLYHTRDQGIRKLAGIDYSGVQLIFQGRIPDEEKLKENKRDLKTYYLHYEAANIPTKLRDVDEVLDWVNTVRFSAPVHLSKSQLPFITKYANALVLKIVNDSYTDQADLDQLRLQAKRDFDEALQRQKDDQESMRNERKEMHQKYMEQNKPKLARKTYSTPVVAPFLPDSSYGFISKAEWDEVFGPHLSTSGHKAGDLIVVDFQAGKYVDNLNGEPLELSMLEDAKDVLLNRQPRREAEQKALKFRKKISKLPRPSHGLAVFKPDFNLGEQAANMEKKHVSFAGIIMLIIVGFIGKQLYKVLKRRMKSGKGPIITGKLD